MSTEKISAQVANQAGVPLGQGATIQLLYEQSGENGGNIDSSNVENMIAPSAKDMQDYSRSGFVWHDPRPPFKGAVE